MNLLLIGQGRLGKHLAVYFEQARIPFQTWNRKLQSQEILKERLDQASHILLAISDMEIEKFHKEHSPDYKNKVWVHFSGSLEVPGVHSLHPLMTFGPRLYPLEKYQSIPFITTSPLHLQELIPGLKNQVHLIEPEFKSKYHALCVLSGNFTTILWQKFIHELQQQKLDGDLARLFAEQTIHNVFDFPETALTGPLARQDDQVQKLNLKALEGDRFAEVYRAFQFAYAGFNERKQNDHPVL